MIYVIAGQTATGKSETAIKLAQVMNAEIISADSVAVYRKLDIGSAKPSQIERANIPHHMIDVLDLDEPFNVAIFQEEARRLIKEIKSREKNVIVVGGTGLYIKALLYDYRFEKEPDMEIERDESTETLYSLLRNQDPLTAETIHPNNRKRIIRALNSFEYHNKTRNELNQKQKDTQIIDAKVFFLHGDRNKVYKRINERVERMFEMGLETEVCDLYREDRNIFEYNSMNSIGYREFESYFNKEIDREQLIALIQRNTRRFAKRQMTWFKNQQPAIWINIDEESAFDVIVKEIKLPV
ncbi:MAG TPA: tRNA (adenosine(37)-N6)-dimethylallyltransferase MiaA [Erysipelothrix sp.]|nr:tRNA (adenosine(37)-N6)-dimethylallyltransferase MiaA [Erysipelothrix sp.]